MPGISDPRRATIASRIDARATGAPRSLVTAVHLQSIGARPS